VAAEYGGLDLSTKTHGWQLTHDTGTEAVLADTASIAMGLPTTNGKFAGINLVNDAVTAKTTSGRLCLESRFKVSTTDADDTTMFWGLMDGAPSTTNPGADDGSGLNNDSVGFFKDFAASTAVDTLSYGSGGVSTTVELNAASLTADTFIQLGMVLDPLNQTMRFFVDGVEADNTAAIAGDAFPNSVNLRPCLFAVNDATASATTVTIDWIRIGQINP
jgi:hypothetical protein